MFGLFQRPKLDAGFVASEAMSNEFTREVSLAGELTLRNGGSDAEVGDVEMMIIAGFRRIPLEVPADWKAPRLMKGGSKTGRMQWNLKLDSPLRAQAGELFVGARDQKGHAWQWRLPFTFELR